MPSNSPGTITLQFTQISLSSTPIKQPGRGCCAFTVNSFSGRWPLPCSGHLWRVAPASKGITKVSCPWKKPAWKTIPRKIYACDGRTGQEAAVAATKVSQMFSPCVKLSRTEIYASSSGRHRCPICFLSMKNSPSENLLVLLCVLCLRAICLR